MLPDFSGGRRIFPECERRVARLRVRRAQKQRSTRAQEGGAAGDGEQVVHQPVIPTPDEKRRGGLLHGIATEEVERALALA